jgi:hypothetical protein
LRHLTNVTPEGRSGELKKYALGVTVLERPESFDPRISNARTYRNGKCR